MRTKSSSHVESENSGIQERTQTGETLAPFPSFLVDCVAFKPPWTPRVTHFFELFCPFNSLFLIIFQSAGKSFIQFCANGTTRSDSLGHPSGSNPPT